MRKFTGYVQTNKVGSKTPFEFEVEDDCTDAQIEEIANETMVQHIEWNYEEVR